MLKFKKTNKRIFNYISNELVIKLLNVASWIILFFSFFAVLLTFYRLGFPVKIGIKIQIVHIVYFIQKVLFIIFLMRFFLLFYQKADKRTIISNLILFLSIILFYVVSYLFSDYLFRHLGVLYHHIETIYLLIVNFMIFLAEYSSKNIYFVKKIKQSILFLIGFVLLIISGALLLLLPSATTNGISIIDAFFTSTSAVCVTGLITLDTATAFTSFGKFIILVLIQLGGLGIMTFTTFFALYLSSSTSFKEYLAAKELLSSNSFSDLSKTLLKIIIFTFSIEAIGALFIWIFLKDKFTFETVHYAIFHSVSAFCNAGFSTKSANLMDASTINNYPLQLTVVMLIILGGIGFPVLLNSYNWIKYLIGNFIRKLLGHRLLHQPKLIKVNTRLILRTTFWLLLAGTVFYLFVENNNILKGHTFMQKLGISFFASVSPRTAGFNTFDYANILPVTTIFTIFLMWIGASPNGTGGGVKTTTFALAVLNIFDAARDKNRIEIDRREISKSSISKAFAVISLSVVAIGTAVALISVFNPELDILKIVFETVSAYSTVGLSMGITSQLTTASKWVLIFTMFVGRVGMFTIFMAFLKQIKHKNYKYPVEDINI